MDFKFEWNSFADQPHNVASLSERRLHHLKHADSYLSLFFSNLFRASSVLPLYRKYKARMYGLPVRIQGAVGVSVSPSENKTEELIKGLKEAGARHIFFRVPSWESGRLSSYQDFASTLHENDFEISVALLQRRRDVFDKAGWEDFLEEVFARLKKTSTFFEIGHAWNRTKWGVWDFKEYLRLAEPAVPLARKHGIKLVGPAVIDFEFHLYPPILRAVPFDRVSSLLYVDRVGAPENKQFGWNTSRKLALLKAVIDGTLNREKELWITEVNWPLKGTGKYSPVSGKPNVSESKQADYLVRYYILSLASGFAKRVYWWQLVAPGYGLIDSRGAGWRKRPSFYAFKTLVQMIEGSTFAEKKDHPEAEIFLFEKEGNRFAVCWTRGDPLEIPFSEQVARVVDLEGREDPFDQGKVLVSGKPKYVFFDQPGEGIRER